MSASTWQEDISHFVLPVTFQINGIIASDQTIRLIGHKSTFARIVDDADDKNIFTRLQYAHRYLIPALWVLISCIANHLSIYIQEISVHNSSKKNFCRRIYHR